MSAVKLISGPDNVAPPVGPYSPATVAGGFVFVSGQCGEEADGTVPASVYEQTKLALANMDLILRAAGSRLSLVLRCGVFLVSMDDFSEMNRAYAEMFGSHRPARTTVAVAALPGGAAGGLKVEIDAVAISQ